MSNLFTRIRQTSLYKISKMIVIAGLIFLALWELSLYSIDRFVDSEFSMDELRDTHLQVPLRVYTKEGTFIGEYGEQRRIPVAFEQVPGLMVKAVLAAEDDRFYEHSGVDPKSLVRAFVNLLKTGEIQQGASTITMQLARNMFLTRERNFLRKITEILYAQKMERELEKKEILELYLNKIFFGHRAYGISAAAQVYYGKELKDLTLAEMAMLAGIPQAPSSNNPASDPESAAKRRDHVLKRMLSLGYISEADYNTAMKESVGAKIHTQTPEEEIPYVSEMVRSRMYECYGDKAYTGGYVVTTTIDTELQKVAQESLRHALWEYSERYGYYGPIGYKRLPGQLPEETLAQTVGDLLAEYPERGGMFPSMVLTVYAKKVVAYNPKVGQIEIGWQDLAWARRTQNTRGRQRTGASPRNAWDILKRGDVIMVRMVEERKAVKERKQRNKKGQLLQVAQVSETPETSVVETRWRLADIPRVEGAMVALHPNDGSIVALAGGFDFYHSKFNRITQAVRQPGSSFKPFIYSAALKRGANLNTPVVDGPLVIRAGGKVWQPRNYSHKYYGTTSLRNALIHSLNLASIRVLMRVGLDPAIEHLTHFGFERKRIPRNLTIVLGTVNITPLELTRGYTVFANGGFLIEPFFVQRIEDMEGRVLYSANPLQVCQECASPTETTPPFGIGDQCLGAQKADADSVKNADFTFFDVQAKLAPRVISHNNATTMTTILKDVIKMGTATRAKVLKRDDIAGKTGTTNMARDAWFVGYSPDLVAATWVGFDQPRSLGQAETGGRAALPMWIEFMQTALNGRPTKSLTLPPPKGVGTRLLLADTRAAPATVTRNSKYRRSASATVVENRPVESKLKRKKVTSSRRSVKSAEDSNSNRSSRRSTSEVRNNVVRSSPPKKEKVVGKVSSRGGGNPGPARKSAPKSSSPAPTRQVLIPAQLF